MSLLINPYRFGAGGAAPATYADEVAADSPVAWWRFEETSGSTVADEIGTNDATVFGANLNVSGLSGTGSAASFDGTDDRINAAGVHCPDEITVEALVNTTQEGRIVTRSTDGSGSNSSYQFLSTAGLLIGIVQQASGGSVRSDVSSPDIGVWAHVAMTRSRFANDGSVLLYVNGVEPAYIRQDTGTNPAADQGTTNIGVMGEGNAAFFGGRIDEPAIYDKVLSPARILAHAQAAGLA